VSELTDRRTVVSRLHALGIRPSKRRGQNFLVDRDVLARIVSEVERAEPESVVEIGPGLGTVTRRLAELGVRVIGVEVDHRLVAGLRQEFAGTENVEIVEEDFLRFDFGALGSKKVYVVGNLPYRITSPILARLIEERARISGAVLLTQAEVAEKIAESPGPHGSALGVFVQAYGEVIPLRHVPRTAFYPVPAVDSVLWRLEFLSIPRFTAAPDDFFAIVRAIYGKRRKMLRRVLRDFLPPDRIDPLLQQLGIDPTRRGETLTIPELDRLASALFG